MEYDRSIFLLDIEIELAWGLIGEKIDKEAKQRMRSASLEVRRRLDNILLLLDEYQIPVTWGILGHVALDHCEGLGAPHPDMPRPSYEWLRKDWYEHDPCKTLAEEPAFYGKDIVDRVIHWALQTKMPHDIACHSFSHQLFGDPGCSEEVAEAELKKCLELIEKNYGIRPKVFIFPRDFPGHINVLRKNGFIAFRGQIPRIITYSESPKGMPNTILKYASLASYWGSFYLYVPPPVVQRCIEQGLTNIPGSMCYNKKPFIPLKLIKSKAIKGIRRAVKEKKIFHLYTHLINFGEALDIEAFLKSFEEILAFADLLRNKNQLEITTIRKFAESGLNG